MRVKGRVLDVVMRDHKGKTVADVALLLTDPTEPVLCTLWNNSVANGEHKQYQAVIGEEVELGLRAETFNGQLKYALFTQLPPAILKAPAANVKAAS